MLLSPMHAVYDLPDDLLGHSKSSGEPHAIASNTSIKSSNFCRIINGEFYGASMTGLFSLRGPSAISRTIRLRIVNPVNFHFRIGGASNIFKKIGIRIDPLVAHFNSFSTIVFITCAVMLVTSFLNAFPCSIFLRRQSASIGITTFAMSLIKMYFHLGSISFTLEKCNG